MRGVTLTPSLANLQQVQVQTHGPLDASVAQLGNGFACKVGCKADGTLIRVTDPLCASGVSFVGWCDAAGNVFLQPEVIAEVKATDFGLVGDDLTLNDAAHAAMLAFALANNVSKFRYPAGVYRFNQTVGPWPEGSAIIGDGQSKFGSSETSGAVIKCTGNGVGVQLGHSFNTNIRNGGRFSGFTVVGGNANGKAAAATSTSISITASASAKTWTRSSGSFVTDGYQVNDYVYSTGFTPGDSNTYRHRIAAVSALVLTLLEDCASETATVSLTSPHFNEIGVEVLGDGAVWIEDCRFGGFRFQVSFDGAEGCGIDRCSFDAQAPTGYPSAEMATDSAELSAFAIRMGGWGFQGGLAANGVFVKRCQFNNTAWGILHHGGVNQSVCDCNFETNLAVIDGLTLRLEYSDVSAEGGTNSNFLTTANSAIYGMRIVNLTPSQTVPLIKLNQACYGLCIEDTSLISMTVPAPVVGSGHLVGVYLSGCIPPNGTGSSVANVIFDSDPYGIVLSPHITTSGGIFPSYIGVGCDPTAPLDVNDNRIRIRTVKTPSSSADSSGEVGDICWDTGFVYVKTANGAWKRAALSTF